MYTTLVTVNPVNDAPTFTGGPGQTVNEDSGLRSVPNWATNISAGPAPWESGQTVTFEQGLAETVEWYRSNSRWIDRVRSGAYREVG